MVDLFPALQSNKLHIYLSPVPDPLAWKEVVFLHPRNKLQTYALPPFAIVSRVLNKVMTSEDLSMDLVAPPGHKKWFPNLLSLLVAESP